MVNDTAYNQKEAAARLKKARRAAGFKTQVDLCTYNGWSQANYNFHESGKRKMSPAVAAKYAEALGISASWILFGNGAGPNGALDSAPDETPVPRLAPREKTIGVFSISNGQPKRVGIMSGPTDLTEMAFAVYMPDNTMAPRVCMGERIILDTLQPPRIGSTVLVRKADGTVLITNLKDMTEGHVVVSDMRGSEHRFKDSEVERVFRVAYIITA